MSGKTRGKGRSQGSMAAGAMLASAVCLLALPSAVLAFTSGFSPKIGKAESQPASNNAIAASKLAARLAPALPVSSLGKGQMFRFTPAANANRMTRSVTVAVRVDPSAVRGILVRGVLPQAAAPVAPVQISPTAFTLGVSRGYHSFAQAIVPPADEHKAITPDIGKFSLAPSGNGESPRFSPRIVLDQREATGRAPRTFAGSEDRVDLGGAYRLGRNLDVTAGVRYSQERDRLRPLTDGKNDSQAVYLGTQFRF